MSEEERTEKATPKKRLEAIKKGNVAKSRDVVAVVGLLGGVGILAATARSQASFALDFSKTLFSRGFELQTTVDSLGASISQTIFLFLGKFALFGTVVVGCAIAANVLQSGFLFLPNKLAPDFSRLDPAKGFSRLFSGEAAFQALFGVVKIVVVAAVVAFALYRDRETLAGLGAASVAELSTFFFRFLTRLALQLCGALVFLAAVDYFWRRWKWENELRMTPQELREEMKEEVGDQKIKGKRREIQRARIASPPADSSPDSDAFESPMLGDRKRSN